MNKLFGLLLLILVLVVGVGFYRGWFSVSSRNSDAGSNKIDVNLTLDPDKIEADKQAVKDRVHELTGEAKEKAGQLIPPASESSETSRDL